MVPVTITLPPEVGRVIATDTTNQPMAGTSAPAALPIPAAPSRQVSRIRTAKAAAAAGKVPRARLNWKEPISACRAPSRNSRA